jgi:lysophospholipase L1-like esterase
VKNKLVSFSGWALSLFLGAAIVSPVIAAINIMPLGDSITRGNSSGVGDPSYMVSYRKALWDLLVARSYEVDLVGSRNDGWGIPGFDADHEGHGGWRDDEIVNGKLQYPNDGKLADWLVAEQPDIVLLHIGTNGLDPSPNDVRNILNVIDAYDPDVWVILARIINRNSYSQVTTDFNDKVEDMAHDRILDPSNSAYPDKIIIVDMEDGAGIDYNLVSDTPPGDMWDDLHPVETGYAKMSVVWLAGLQAILPVANAGPQQQVCEGDTVTLDASKSVDPNGTIVSYLWEQQPGGPSVTLSNPRVVRPTFTAPNVEIRRETLTFKLTVTDTDGLESTANVRIVVWNTDPNNPNSCPPKGMPWIPLLLLDK